MQINGVKQGYVHYRWFEDVQTTLDSNGVQFLKSTNATNAIIALLNNYMHHYIR